VSDHDQRITVLLVDDEKNILRALQRLLMDDDCDIETATSAAATLEILEHAENVGVIVSDQRINAVFDGFLAVVGDRNAVHARTVSTLATDVARKMNLDSTTVATFRLAALLHDAGKYGSMSASLDKHREEMSDSEENDCRHPTASSCRLWRNNPAPRLNATNFRNGWRSGCHMPLEEMDLLSVPRCPAGNPMQGALL